MTKFVRASSLDVTGAATDLLIEHHPEARRRHLPRRWRRRGYQQDEKFAAAGVGLRYQAFEHPTYPQLAERRPARSVDRRRPDALRRATAPAACSAPIPYDRKRPMDIRGKKLVVIGGAGLIGSHTVDALTREDVGEIVIYDNFVRGSAENLAERLTDDRVRIFEAGGDICQTDILAAALDGADACFPLRRAVAAAVPRISARRVRREHSRHVQRARGLHRGTVSSGSSTRRRRRCTATPSRSR